MSSMLPGACLRKFNELELYFCYGCHYDEPTSTFYNSTVKRITLCQDYAIRLWGGDLTEGSDNSEIIIPSLYWSNAYEFFADVKPPFFKTYEVIITNNPNADCFDTAQYMFNVTGFLVLLLALLLSIQ
ncbi:UNKNOWN [Stylonychia lemnae]|uniref:Uncharacterized protein n=1 Tax=Stylonychia lemnae TaxID=5949 RepID=A0A078AER8_STYLE|nr:UNKNOWN [Stylonychia lemnae]|eukprot:CDW80769.1 UNKNOWN [Stylonychia lemnae]